jgi:carboxyl-terminal processing protease
LLAALRARKIADPQVGPIRATPDGRGAVPAIERQIGRAVARYGSRVDVRELVYATIRGELATLHDPYSVLFTKRELSAFSAAIDGTAFGGVGIVLASNDPASFWHVDQVFANGPAARAGVLAGDVVTAVDGVGVAGATSAAIVALLRGPSGSIVRVSIERNGTPLPAALAIRRADVAPPSVTSKRLAGDVAYVTLRSFDATAATEVHAALAKLEDEGTRATILDLRGNGGGYESAAVHVASLFVASGPVVAVQENRGKRIVTNADGTALPARPLLVLVDGDSASGAELVAAAIHDRGVGRLVGTRTFGKGVVQTMFPLPDGAAIKLTTARYFTPAGRNIDHVGIEPDVVVARPAGTVLGSPGRDPQLDRALALLVPVATPTP